MYLLTGDMTGDGSIDNKMQYQSKQRQLPGTDHSEVIKNARKAYTKVQKLTKRQPYVRSQYFSKDKIFVGMFWTHLVHKRKGEQIVRTKLLLAALDLLRNNIIKPESVFDNGHALHRFYGKTADGMEFVVQVKHDLKTGRKDFMSVFPRKESKRKQ
jgi:hypothetical protein